MAGRAACQRQFVRFSMSESKVPDDKDTVMLDCKGNLPSQTDPSLRKRQVEKLW